MATKHVMLRRHARISQLQCVTNDDRGERGVCRFSFILSVLYKSPSILSGPTSGETAECCEEPSTSRASRLLLADSGGSWPSATTFEPCSLDGEKATCGNSGVADAGSC